MSLLVDRQINEGLKNDPTLATNVKVDDFEDSSSRVQAASLDLTVGDIFVPGVSVDQPGGAYTPTKEITLDQGHTAVIRTAERLNLGKDLAGIAFPPASLSIRGLLTTNPGHIDPGYKGPLHITVINMSRKPVSLRRGDRIMRVLFIELADEPSATFSDRHKKVGGDIISPELLDQLSVDFLDFEQRAEKIAQTAIEKLTIRATILSTLIPIVVAGLALMGNVLAGYQPQREEIKKLDIRLSVMEAKQASNSEDRFRKIEEQLRDLTKTKP